MPRLLAFQRLGMLRRSEEGGALVELAVVLPILILMAIGVMDYGRVYFTSLAVANAARAGAEWGAYGQTGSYVQDTEMQNFAKLEAAEIGTITVTSNHVCRCSPGGALVACVFAICGTYGQPQIYVEVTASKSVALLLKYPGLPTSINVSRTATFRTQ